MISPDRRYPPNSDLIQHDSRQVNGVQVTGNNAKVIVAEAGKEFGGRQVLADISFEIAEGSVVSVIGPSGCGKSTLLRMIAGLSDVSDGVITLDGAPVHGLSGRIGIGFQEPRLLPWRTVSGNIAFGLQKSFPRKEREQRVEDLLHVVRLDGYGKHRPKEISGGMAQRVSLARALARDPEILLLDEPFGALDALTRIAMQQLLGHIQQRDRRTILLVTHDVNEALYLSDEIIVLGWPQRGITAAEGRGAAQVIERITLSDPRPRDVDSPGFSELRESLLSALGVTTQPAVRSQN